MPDERAERFEVLARVLLELPGRRAFIGNTVNVSDSGVYFDIGYEPNSLELHEQGLFHLMPLNSAPIRACKVARISESGIAINFLEKQPVKFNSQLQVATEVAA
ncbi:MAG: PilZ domain-containing protein [Magnetococcales bacterium]|nr:PilZ domain-containing protein [Magnetococcales bacterium]